MPDDIARDSLIALADRHYAAADLTRKSDRYLREYERLLAPRRHEALRILELGVSSGASLLVWRDYLPNAIIVGLDIDAMPECLAGVDRVHFLRARQDDQKALDQAAAIVGGQFDLIVDDASHIGYLTKRSLHYLFRQWLRPGGTYVIEDFGTAYIADYPDSAPFVASSLRDAVPGTKVFASHQSGMVGVIKQLVEPLMQELMTGTRSHLPIERLQILTNIAFIERGGDPPGPISDTDAEEPGVVPKEMAETMARAEALEGRVADLETRLTSLEGMRTGDRIEAIDVRLDRVESTVNRVLGPLRRLSRALGLSGR
jgi:hypothetical protein